MVSLFCRICSLLTLSLLVACSIKGPGLSDLASEQNGQGKILLVNTNSKVERYELAEKSFLSLFSPQEVERLDLGNEDEPVEVLLDLFNDKEYAAVYCIGAKSLGLVDYIDTELPVVFSSVLNWRKFQEHTEYHGVASEVSLVAQLTWFKYFFPELNALGVIYSEENEALVEDARVVASKLNIRLLAEKVSNESEVQNNAETLLPKVQALWLISDPAVLASESRVGSLFKLAKNYRVPVLTFNELFIDIGALLSISADLPTMSRQAAMLLKSVLLDGPKAESVVYPAGSRIILNQKTLESTDLKINEDALESLSDIRY